IGIGEPEKASTILDVQLVDPAVVVVKGVDIEVGPEVDIELFINDRDRTPHTDGSQPQGISCKVVGGAQVQVVQQGDLPGFGSGRVFIYHLGFKGVAQGKANGT